MSLTQFYIDNNSITIFSKAACPFCVKAINLLKKYNVSTNIVDLGNTSDGPELFRLLNVETGRKTVPNIYVFGKNIGGYSELEQLHKSGELFNMLKKNLLYICEFCGKESTSKELSCKCFPRQFTDWGAPI